jgi:hypothetical protein
MLDYTRKTYCAIGDKVRTEIAFSECAMSMQIAGKVLEVELIPSEGHGAMAQVYREGKPYSAPILLGEAGIYIESVGRYYYYPAMDRCGKCANCGHVKQVQIESLRTLAMKPGSGDDVRLIWNRTCEDFPCTRTE